MCETVWGADERMKYISTALFSEFAPPVPRPPPNELGNQVALATITSHPHLFHITTPINVDRFQAMLTPHPNRDLVVSVCRGLREGFWPWAIAAHSTASPIVDNAALQKIGNPEHTKFIQEQRDEEVALQRFSELFDSLLPDMTTIPLWVMPKPHPEKLRLVANQTVGDFSQNSFISLEDARVHLDLLHALGSALICAREQHSNIPLVLFKSDTQVHRRLPVHPLWQIRQVALLMASIMSTMITTLDTEERAAFGSPSV